MQEKIKEILKEEEIDLNGFLELGDTVKMFDVLESYEDLNIGFSVNIRCNDSSDYWLEATYFSSKLKTGIVLDGDFNSEWEDEAEIESAILRMRKLIDEYESKII